MLAWDLIFLKVDNLELKNSQVQVSRTNDLKVSTLRFENANVRIFTI